MKTVADIMTVDVISLSVNDNIFQARELLRQHNIRHLPVLDEKGRFSGILTQRDLLNSAFMIVEKYGVGKLVQKEEQTQVADVMSRDNKTMASSTPLLEAGEFFLEHKQHCLPIVDKGELKGIITSIDFVKLSLYLLKSA